MRAPQAGTDGSAPTVAGADRGRFIALIVLLVALRAIYTYFVPYLIGDTRHYIAHTDLMVEGRWSEIEFLFFNGYFVPLAPLTWLGLPTYPTAIVLGYVLAIVSAFLIRDLVRHFGGTERTALLAVGIYAIQPLAVQYGATAKMEHFFAASFLAGIWLLAVPRRIPRTARGVASGLAFGWSVLLRNEGLFLLAALIAGWLFERHIRSKRRSAPAPRAISPHIIAAATCAVVVIAYVALLSPKIDGPVIFGKAESVNVGNQDDKAAFAELVIHVKEGNPIPQKRLPERLAHNLSYSHLSLTKAFFSPLFLLPWVLPFIRPARWSQRRNGCPAILLLILLTFAGYACTTLFHRYLYFPMVLSIIPGALGYAAIRERSPGPFVRVVLWIFLIAPLLAGTVLRTWHDHPKGLSADGLEDLYRAHVAPGSIVYVPFSHEPPNVIPISADRRIEHETLPQVKERELGTLLRPGHEEVFVWLDSYYIWAYFEDGEYLRQLVRKDFPRFSVERVQKIERSPRNPGYFLRVSRRIDGATGGAAGGREGALAPDPDSPVEVARQPAGGERPGGTLGATQD